MRSSIAIPVLLGAGAIAHPHFKLNNPLAHVHHKRQDPVKVITTTIGNQVQIEDIFVSTIYGNAPVAPPTVTPVPNAPAAAPKKLEVAPVQNKPAAPVVQHENLHVEHHDPPAPAPVSTPPPASTPVASAPVESSAPSTGGNDGAPQSGGKSILESANKFRTLMGFKPFTYSQQLDGNAAKTNNDDGSNSMTHELNSGSMAQCIAQVDNKSGGSGFTPFELTYLGWLCEIDDSRLGTMCDTMKDLTHMKVDKSDPGHAQILRNPAYSQMGCNYMDSTQQHDNYAGQYTCDFA
ncbi:hypothetical protein ACLMJK_000461 [Lecanora helva]